MYRAIIKAEKRTGHVQGKAEISVEDSDERFAAFLAVAKMNDHPVGQYIDSYTIQIDYLS